MLRIPIILHLYWLYRHKFQANFGFNFTLERCERLAKIKVTLKSGYDFIQNGVPQFPQTSSFYYQALFTSHFLV